MNDTITIGLKKLENKKRIAILDEARAMDKPHALRLAQWLDNSDDPMYSAAAELRRLHQVNQELVEALSLMCDTFLDTEGSHGQLERNSIEKAQAILAKHRGQE